MNLIRFLYKILVGIFYRVNKSYTRIYSLFLFKMEGIIYGKNIKIFGVPIVYVSKHGGIIKIGDAFSMNSGRYYNQIGRQQKCFLIVGDNSKIIIGNNVGISSTAIICYKEIEIEDNVKIGGNTVIYDSDFHDLDYKKRNSIPEDTSNVRKLKVTIKKNAFIGSHSTILKGVTIGENSIVGAASVVSSDIPPNQIWAGNPAKFIRAIT